MTNCVYHFLHLGTDLNNFIYYTRFYELTVVLEYGYSQNKTKAFAGKLERHKERVYLYIRAIITIIRLYLSRLQGRNPSRHRLADLYTRLYILVFIALSRYFVT